MSNFEAGIPDITVIIRENKDTNIVNLDVPDISVVVQRGDDYSVNIKPNSTHVSRTGSFSSYADLAGLSVTSSYVEFAASASYVVGGFSGDWNALDNKPSGLVSASSQINTGSFSGSFVGDGTGLSLGNNTLNSIAYWNTPNTLGSSILYYTGSSVVLGATNNFFDETNPDVFGIYAGIRSSFNLISAHATVDNYLQINVRNFSTSSAASSDIVATSDTGNEETGYINMGINGANFVGTRVYDIPGDGYLYTTGSNLVIGTSTANSTLSLFAGGEEVTDVKLKLKANNNHELTGSITTTQGITVGGHILPSADEQYDLGSASNKFRDLYLSGSTLYLGDKALTISNGYLKLIQSGSDPETAPPVPISGSFTGSLLGTAEFALTASYVPGAASDWSTLSNKPDGIVSSSVQTLENISGSDIITNKVESNEFKILAGNVALTLTGSVTTGIFGATELIAPYILTSSFSAATVEYVASRQGGLRVGMILAGWSGSTTTVTDISSTDVGDTSDIRFSLIQDTGYIKLRVESLGSGSYPWTVQSLFKLFPTLL